MPRRPTTRFWVSLGTVAVFSVFTMILYQDGSITYNLQTAKNYTTTLKFFLQTNSIETESFSSRYARASVNGDLLTAQEYINTPETFSVRNCAYAEGSKMRVYDDRKMFRLNEDIRVLFDLYDMNGRRLNRGGDMVRVWMREKSKKANSAGYVVDFRNGSYMGILKALWTGEPEIVAEIAGVRETIQTIYRIVYKQPAGVSLVVYQNGNVSETKQCYPSPGLLPYKDLCNMTTANYGSEWYCGKPQKKKLVCHDYALIKAGFKTGNLSSVEKDLEKRCHKRFNETLKIKVVSDSNTDRIRPQLPCNKRPLQDTWTDGTPVGYMYKNRWHPRMCQSSVKLSVDEYHSCLRNRRLLIFGDSTTRRLFRYLRSFLVLETETEKITTRKFYKYAVVSKKEYNYSVIWAAHEQPFLFADQKNPHFFRPIGSYLDELSPLSNDFILFHIYVHLAFFSPDVYRGRVRRIAQAVKRLVARASNVRIAIRGCHVFSEKSYYHVDDYWGKVYDKILREEFRDVRDKLLFLDNWDLTLGEASQGIHQVGSMISNSIHYFFMYMCGR